MSYKDILKKVYEKGEIIPASQIKNLPPVATSSPSCNWAMGGGIYPGRSYIMDGAASTGKTMFTTACVAELLRATPDSVVYWFDAELRFTNHWLSVFMPDIDHDRVQVRPTKQPIEIFDYFVNDVIPLVEEKGLNVVACVIDSVSSIIPPKESAKKTSEDSVYSALANYLPSALRMISTPSKKNNITWFFVSQVGANLDPSAKYTGEKFVISGGYKFRHEIDVEMQFTIVESKDSRLFDEDIKNMNDQEHRRGHTVRVTNKKNSTGIPYRVAEFQLDYQQGIVNTEVEIAKLGLNLGIITKDGNTFYFDGQKLAVGAPKTLELIASSKAIQARILEEVFKKDKK